MNPLAEKGEFDIANLRSQYLFSIVNFCCVSQFAGSNPPSSKVGHLPSSEGRSSKKIFYL